MIRMSHALFVTLVSMILLTWFFSSMLDENYARQSELQNRLWALEEECSMENINKISYKVTVTTYNPTRAQCDDTPHITADGTKFKTWKATEYRYVALSRDLLSRWGGPFDYGDYIVIEGTGKWVGVYQVRDTMNPKWTNRVDILTTNSNFKYDNVTMYKYVKEGINS